MQVRSKSAVLACRSFCSDLARASRFRDMTCMDTLLLHIGFSQVQLLETLSMRPILIQFENLHYLGLLRSSTILEKATYAGMNDYQY